MLDGVIFENSLDFCKWFYELNPNESLDMSEAMTIYFNLEKYENLGVM